MYRAASRNGDDAVSGGKLRVSPAAMEGYTSFRVERLEIGKREPELPGLFHPAHTEDRRADHPAASSGALRTQGCSGVLTRRRDFNPSHGRRYKPRSLPEAPVSGAVFGHNLGRSLEKYFPDREIRRVALLRDPISLHLSLYNHRMMLHLTKGLGTYSFDLHLKALPRDFVAHRLLARWLEIPWPTLMAMTDQQKYTGIEPGIVAILVRRLPYGL